MNDTLPTQVSPPEFTLSALRPHALRGIDVVALAVLPETGAEALSLGPGAAELEDATGLDLLGVIDAVGAVGKAGEVTSVAVPSGTPDNEALRQILLVGVGSGTSDDLRRAGAAVARATKDRGAVATTIPIIAGDGAIEAFVIGLTLGSFGFHWRSTGPTERPVGKVVIAGAVQDDADELTRAVALGGAGWRARVLATVPANLKTPQWLAEQAIAVAAESGLNATVWDEKRLAKDGFGGILGVGMASAAPPRLIRLDYRPRKSNAKTPHVVLVGKGITFDTGGLSIKPADAMVNMKRDMTGGAVVISVLAALAAVSCPVRVTGLVAAAENSIGEQALRPGDVLRHYGGRTTEVTNTDAEGRLVLADAMAYAVDQLKPDAIVDVATLTGAMKVALGQQVGGYFANHEGLAAALFDAGQAAGEPMWRFPLVADYEERLASKVADADNAPGGGGGAITAALFLQHFTGDVPWAHLDIASVGDAATDAHEWTAGPTGFGARLLLNWLGNTDSSAVLQGI